jgi:peptidoglycan/xylan/chitin deacetylase (PgdA/CDA1 family)
MSKKFKILIGSSCLILLGLFFLRGFLQRNYVAPIIMYHYVTPGEKTKAMLEVSLKSFQRQMHFLRQQKYNILPLEKLADLIQKKAPLPPKTIAITFDDGFKEVYTQAFPVLKKYNIPAAMFIIIDAVGRPGRLTWGQIKEMRDSGLITFGSHTFNHRDLVRKIKSDTERKRQIADSKRILEQKLERPVTMFSYPAGLFNSRVRQMVIDAGYKLAVATIPGKDYPNDDIYALKRLRIGHTSDNLFVFWFETSGIYTLFKEYKKYYHED